MKTFDWKEFRVNKIAVHCKTEQESDNFMEVANELGFSVKFDEPDIYDNYFDDTCYRMLDMEYIVFSPVSYYAKAGYTILEWSDYMEFAKGDLKAGMLVETNYGKSLVMPCKIGLVLAYGGGSFELVTDIKFESIKNVWGYSISGEFSLCFDTEYRDILYARNKEKEMTVAEVSKALGYTVKIVKE